MADPAHDPAEDFWRTAVGKVLKGAALDTMTTRTRDGIAIAPLSPAAPGAGPGPWRATADVGVFTRVDHPDPGAANALARLDLENGATGLVLVGSGSASAHGFGLAPGDLSAVLDGLPLWPHPVRLEFAAADQAAAIETLMVEADRAGYAPEALTLDLGLDPLQPPTDLCGTASRLRDCGVAGPLLRADGRPHHDAGASEAQELAAVLAAGVAGLRALEPLGLEVARQALGLTLTADTDELLTIAKIRALRRLWMQVETACGLAPKPIPLHAETAWRTMTRRDPYTNILRATLATANALLGGADGVTVLPFTSALGLPDAFARRLARNTALVLRDEAHLGRVTDPAAGSGSFEALTDALAAKAWAVFQEIERQGGLTAALASGWWAGEITAARALRAETVADGTATLVGVTRYRNLDEALPTVLMAMPDDASGSSSALSPWREGAGLEDVEH